MKQKPQTRPKGAAMRKPASNSRGRGLALCAVALLALGVIAWMGYRNQQRARNALPVGNAAPSLAFSIADSAPTLLGTRGIAKTGQDPRAPFPASARSVQTASTNS